MHLTSSFDHQGHELVYGVYGSGEELVVYTHGLLMDSDLNRGMAESLAERGARVVLLDLLGHGRSDKPLHAAAYRIDSYADQVVGLLDHLGADDAVLGGVSLGANASLFAASQHPDRVRGLVLEMPVLEWAVPAAALAFVPMLLGAHWGRPLLARTSALARRLPRTPFDALNSVISSVTHPPELVAAVLHGVLVGPVAPTQDQRESITAPTIVLGHRYDLIHPFSDADNLVRQLADARLVPTRSAVELRLFPERLTGEITAFLDEVWSAPRRGARRPTGAR